MGEITIRPAGGDDLAALVAASAALFAEDAGTYDPAMDIDWPHKHGLARFTETIVDPARRVLVAVDANDLVGTLSGGIVEPSEFRPVRVASVNSLYVRPTHRSLGIGARLIADFRDWARASGADRLTVDAFARNAGALRFYERQGFRPLTVILETIPWDDLNDR